MLTVKLLFLLYLQRLDAKLQNCSSLLYAHKLKCLTRKFSALLSVDDNKTIANIFAVEGSMQPMLGWPQIRT